MTTAAMMVGFVTVIAAVMTWMCLRRRRPHRTNRAEQWRWNVARGKRIRDTRGLREVPRGYRDMAEELDREKRGGAE